MTRLVALLCVATLFGCQSADIEKPGFASQFPASQWSEGGFGGTVKYRCKVDACGGTKTSISYDVIYARLPVQELGISSGTTVEKAFRENPSVKTTLVALLKNKISTTFDEASYVQLNYYSNGDYVGYRISGRSSKNEGYFDGEVRFDDNNVILVGAESPSANLSRSTFAKFKRASNI